MKFVGCCLIRFLATLCCCVSVAAVESKTFSISGAAVVLDDFSAELDVYFRSMRFNRAQQVWNVDVVLSNRTAEAISGPFVLQITSAADGTTRPSDADGTQEGKPFFDLSAFVPRGILAGGETSLPRTISLVLGTQAPLNASTLRFARRPHSGLAFTRTLDAEGLPLPDMSILEVGPSQTRTLQTDPRFGIVTLAQESGLNTWRFEDPSVKEASRLKPAWRQAIVPSSGVLVLPNPRLTPRISTNDAGLAANPPSTVVTPLTAQTLPFPLPIGWSPLQAFWVEKQQPMVTVTARPWDAIAPNDIVAWAQLDTNQLQWRVIQNVTASETNALTVSVPVSAPYALVVADTGTVAPPKPTIGAALPPSAAVVPASTSFSAAASVNPTVSTASQAPELVTGTANVIFSTTTPVPSGQIFRTLSTESYRLRDGTRRITPQYESFITAYQRPGDQRFETLQASFPIRPLLLLGSDELSEAIVRVDVLGEKDFTGSVIDQNGGEISSGGIRLLAGSGTFAQSQAIYLRSLPATNLNEIGSFSNAVTAAFELGAPETTKSFIVNLAAQGTNSLFVLARVVTHSGVYGFEPMERFRSDGSGRLISLEPVTGERLPGVNGSGLYVLIREQEAQGLITGTTRDSAGNAQGDLLVRLNPWSTFSGSDGRYRLLSPAGTANLAVSDLASGNQGLQSTSVTNASVPTLLDLSAAPSGPRVIGLAPGDGAKGVSRVAPIEITFSAPVNPGTIVGNGIRLLDTNGATVSASVSLNLRNTKVTLLPVEQLAPERTFTIQLSTNIADATAKKLEGQTSFTFKTETDALVRTAAEVTIYEGTNGVVAMSGSVGSAEPETPVILVNESTGATVTVLARVDGSFTNSIEGDVNDQLSGVVINKNGSRTTIPVGRQVFRDGTVGLFNQGGVISAQGEGRTVELKVDSGSVAGRTLFKVQVVPKATVQKLVEAIPPEEGKIVTPGIGLSIGEGRLHGPIHLSMPVTADELKAAGLPDGGNPTNGTFVLVSPIPVGSEGGYLVVDQLFYEDGKLVTHSTIDEIRSFAKEKDLQVQQFIRDNAELLSEIANVGFVVVGAVLGGFAGGASGAIAGAAGTAGSLALGTSATEMLMLPLFLSLQSVPAIFEGNVTEITFSSEGAIVRERGLPGAMVTLAVAGHGGVKPRPGHLVPGGLFALTTGGGNYKIIRSGARGINEDLEFGLTATHPRYFGQRSFRVANPLVNSILSRTDLFFFRLDGASTDPPTVSVSQDVTHPAPDDTVQLEILATTAQSTGTPSPPEVEVAIARLDKLPGSPEPRRADVTLTFVSADQASATTRRLFYKLRSTAIGQITLRVAAYTPFGDPAITMYPVLFGAPINRPDEPPPPDLNDDKGPRVVRAEPSDGTVAWPVDRPIQIEFNEAMSKALGDSPTLIQMLPAAGEPALTLSQDGHTLTLAYPGLVAGTPYQLTIPASVAVDATPTGNLLDQFPDTPPRESFQLHFRTAERRSGQLSGIAQGGGVVVNGIYAYVLEQLGSLDGAVVAYDLSNPTQPVHAGALSVPGFPRAAALIPGYSFQQRPDQPPRTSDLLAVGGGKIGKSFASAGEDLGGFQYLWILDLADPGKPKRIASVELSATGSAAVDRIVWSPPYLSVLISEADSQKVDLIKLQSFIYGLNLSQDEFRRLPPESPGKDANGDGDYVDFSDGDILPIPGRLPGTYAGLDLSFPSDSTIKARWLDHSWDGVSATLGVVMGAGKGPNGQAFAGAYQTIFRQGQSLDPALTLFPFATDRPRRVLLVSDVPIPNANGQRIGEIAILSMTKSDGTGSIATLDVTDPQSPRLIGSNPIPPVYGPPQSAKLLPDGRLAVSTPSQMLVLDIFSITAPAAQSGAWKGMRGVISGVGAQTRTFGFDQSGLVATSAGGNNIVGQTAPLIQFARFSGDGALVNPEALRQQAESNPGAVLDVLRKAEIVEDLAPARLRAIPNVIESSINPLKRKSHYHALIHAPGSAGETIQLLVEALNADGGALHDNGRGMPPVRALNPDTVERVGGIADCAAKLRPLIAQRLSSNPASSLYNVYLSVPFALLYEAITSDELETLRSGTPQREVYWSGALMRVGFDPATPDDNVLKSFAYTIDGKRLRPGVTALAHAFPADYLMGPNPPPATDQAVMPGTFGTVLAHNGEFRVETVDFELPSRRLPIRFERVCAGQDLYQGVFGRGWDFLYNQRIAELRGVLFEENGFPLIVRGNGRDEVGKKKDLLLHTGRGRTLMYQFKGETSPPEIEADPLFHDLGWDQSGVAFYLPFSEGVFDFVVRFRDGRFARLEPDGTQVWYNPSGRLEEMRDRYPENKIRFEYDREGLLRRIVDKSVRSDRFLKVGYYQVEQQGDTSYPNEVARTPAEAGKVRRLVDYTGRELNFFYNSCGELERREGPLVTFAHEDGFKEPPGPIARYETSQSENTPKANGLRGITAGSGGSETLITADSPAANDVPVVTGATSAGMQSGLKLHLQQANTAAAVQAGGAKMSAAQNADGAQTEVEVDKDGRVKVVKLSGNGADAATTTYVYQGGLLRKVTYPLGNSVTYQYFDGHPVFRSRGNIKSITRDPGARGVAGDPFQISQFQEFERRYNFPTGPTTDFAGNAITLVATPDGRDIGRIEYGPDGVVQRGFNNFGQLTSETSPQGFQKEYAFHTDKGFLLSITEGKGDQNANLITEFDYGPPMEASGFRPGDLGLATKVTPPDRSKEVIHLNYDQREQLVTRTRGSQFEHRSYDVNGHLVRLATSVDDSRDRVITSHYAQNGFLLDTTVHDVEVDGAGKINLTTKYDPDPLFRVQRVTHPGSRIIEFSDFDHLGHPKTKTIGTYIEHMVYDVDGNVLSVERGGATEGYEYDGFDRLKKETLTNGDNPETVERTYHPNGEIASLKVTGLTGVNQDITWEVDSLGRPSKQVTRTDTAPRTLTWKYDQLRTTETEVVTGEQRSQTFDSAGRPKTISDSTRTVTHGYSGDGNLETIQSDEHGLTFSTTLHYDSLDRLERGDDQLGQIFHQEVRSDGRPTKVFNALEGRTDIALSLLGERLSLTRANLVHFRYGWDEERRMTAAGDSRNNGESRKFDPQFRLASSKLQDGATTTYSTPDFRLNQFRDSNGSGRQVGREFDDKGRLTSRDVNFRGDLRHETYTYDGLNRPVDVSFPGGTHHFGYDLLGPVKQVTLTAGGPSYDVVHMIRADGAVTRVNYPGPEALSVDLGRDSAGRLQTVTPLGPQGVVSFTSYAAAGLVGSQLWGGTNLFKVEMRYNARGRMLGKQYTRLTDGAVVVDLRYAYDPLNNFVVRQQIERAGRADLFLYDTGARLIGAHYGARAAVSGEAARTGYTPFDLPPGISAAPGFYSRGYQYDLQSGLDTLLTVPAVNPDQLPVITFGHDFTGSDPFLLPQVVDGFQIGKDELGNVTRTRLMAWNVGEAEPHATPATLRYNGLNHLLSVAADIGGISASYEYDAEGFLFHRTLQDPRLPGGTAQSVLVWDDGRLLAEFDRTGGTNKLKARYYYFSSDVPVAMDQRQADGQLHRFYFLSDAIGNVVALADDKGLIISRYQYDAWGQFRPEGPDRQVPYVKRIVATRQSFQLEFNETVLPPVSSSSFPAPELASRSFGDVAEVRLDGTVVGGSWRYVEQGNSFGVTLQFQTSKPIVGAVQVHVKPGVAIDSWNNANLDQTFNFTQTAATAVGAVLANTDVADVPPGPIVLSPFLFQGQLFDADVGLYYLRARFYDPFTGRFLQRDPEPYLDSPNSYAGFANNPTTTRDPSGRAGSYSVGAGRGVRPLGVEPIAQPRAPRAIPLDEATPPPASPRAASATPALEVTKVVGRPPLANAAVDRVAPATARVRANAEGPPPPREPSQVEIAQLEAFGRERIAELDALKASGRRTGRLAVVEEDLGEVTVRDGQFTEGTLGTHKYSEKADKSVIRINSRARAIAEASPEGSVLRKQLRVAELHELSHADNALNVKKSAPMGKGKFLEELGVHREQIGIEYVIYGRDNPAAMSSARQAYEAAGEEGIANVMLRDPDYQELFNVRTRRDAIRLLRHYNMELRISESYTFGEP